MSQDWKRYPHAPEWGDPRWFTFPDCDGELPHMGMETYFVDGFLTGQKSGRHYAFMTIFTDMRVLGKRLRASFYTFALYDLDKRHYGTFTEYDFPRPPRIRRRHKIENTPGHLGLSFSTAHGKARWENAGHAAGDLRPFAWLVDLCGRDHHGAEMRLQLDIDAQRPPAPIGGVEQGGKMMFLGAEETFSYYQSGLDMSGHLRWGDIDEPVEGHVGWIDRQWAEADFTKHQDRQSTRYRHEWRVMQFDNGWDMSCFHQYNRHAHNMLVPWTGMSAQGPAPDFELWSTHRVELMHPEFIRSPGIVRGQAMLTEGPRYFPYRYRMLVPEWDLDVSSEPFIEAPAHQLPIEYWTGPVKIRGVVFGEETEGVGFDERCCPRLRDFELSAALQLTIEHVPGLEEDERRQLELRAWEVEALALRGDRPAAARHLRHYISPSLAAAKEEVRARVLPLASDLLDVLEGRAAR